MHPPDIINLIGIVAAILSLLTIAVWACRDWRQAKIRKQTDEAIATLETAVRPRPGWLADSRLPMRKPRRFRVPVSDRQGL